MRQRVIYLGQVQGVGFRATTASIARRHPVVGFVRNLPDGTVELVADGSPEVVKTFLADIADAFQGRIRDQTLTDADPAEVWTSFKIRR